jgi:hypothetical protein
MVFLEGGHGEKECAKGKWLIYSIAELKNCMTSFTSLKCVSEVLAGITFARTWVLLTESNIALISEGTLMSSTSKLQAK